MQNSETHHLREPQPIAEQESYLKRPQYWGHDACIILDNAKGLAENILKGAKEKADETPKTEDVKLPKWVALMSDENIAKLKNQARVFDDKVIEYSEAIFNGQLIRDNIDLTNSTKLWYSSLGPTNESEDLKDVFIRALSYLESEPDTPERNLLMGNILQDLALRESDSEKSIEYLVSALNTYSENLKKYKNINNESVRTASRHSIDCEHQLISMFFEKGKITKEEFVTHFKRLQIISIQEVGKALKNDEKFDNGELFEWAFPIFARHTHFIGDQAEKFDVRSGLIREDKAIYPWRLEGGQGPLWSFDTIIKSVDKPNSVERIQLKSGEPGSYSDGLRIYIPNVVTLVTASELQKNTLRDGIKGYLNKIKNDLDLMTSPNIPKVKEDESTSRVMDFFDDMLKKAS